MVAEGPPDSRAELLLGEPRTGASHWRSPTILGLARSQWWGGLAWGLVGVSVWGWVGAVIYDVLHKPGMPAWGAGVGVGPPPDTPLSAGCLACPVRIPCPLGTAMFSSWCSPSHWRPPATLEPSALGVLNEGPDQGRSRLKSFLEFSLHQSPLSFYWA